MKKTLNNLLSFSLFALLSSFSLFVNSATFSANESWQPVHKDSCSALTTQTYSSALSACRYLNSTYKTFSDIPSAGGCSSSQVTCQTSVGQSTNVRAKRISTAICPSNSTASGSTCSPNAGFSAVNNDPSANGGTGSWSVVPAGSECSSTSTVYNVATGVCDGVTANTSCPSDKPYLRYSQSSNSYYCHATDVSGDGSDIGLLATLTGLSMVVLTGAYTSLAACFATLVCGAGLVLAAAGSALVGFDFATGDTPTQPTSKAGALTVVLAPSNPAPENDVLKVLPNGAMIPPANSTPTSDIHVVSYVKDGVTHNIDTQKAQSSYSGSFGSDTSTGVLSATPTGSVNVKSASSKTIGTSGGQAVQQIKTVGGSVSSSNTNPNLATSTQYQTGDTGEPSTTQPPIDGGSTGGTGTGGGDCSLEPQKCLLLTNIQNALKGTGTNGEVVLTGLDAKQDQVLSDFQAQAQSLVQSFYNSDLWANQFLSSMTDTPNPFSYLGNKSGSCAYSFNAPGGQQTLDMCPHLDVIHPAMAFGFFILLMFGIRDLILEKETT